MNNKTTSTTKKLTTEELTKLVKNIVREAARSTLTEGQDFTARRAIKQAAEAASLDFEKNILQTFGLVHPDKLQPELQKRYLHVAETLKVELVNAVMKAVTQLAAFPKETDGK